VRFRRDLPPKDGALGLSSMLYSPVPRAELPLFWTPRFHSPETNPADRVRTFQSFGRLRNLPCADRQILSSTFCCRISLRLSNKIGARASGPHRRFCLIHLEKCGAEPRAPIWRLRCVRIDLDATLFFVSPNALIPSPEARHVVVCPKGSGFNAMLCTKALAAGSLRA
jgi:hypothetical protein